MLKEPLIEKRKNLYKLFSIPLKYEIDKDNLKKTYFKLSKMHHPDLNSSNSIDSSKINDAFFVLNDDFARAKLFTSPSEKLDDEFLIQCLELEDKIILGQNVKNDLNKKIEECRFHYNDPIWVAKWAYYKRLLDMTEGLDKRL